MTWNDLVLVHHMTKTAGVLGAVGQAFHVAPLALAGYGGYSLYQKGSQAVNQHRLRKMQTMQMKLQQRQLKARLRAAKSPQYGGVGM